VAAGGDGLGDDAVDVGELALVDQRPERDLLGVRVADRQVLRPLGQPVEVLIGYGFEHDVPARGHADLALVQERTPRAGRAGYVDIGVVEHDERVVAAEFQADAFQRPPCGLADQPADRGRAGERDHRHVRALGQRGAGFGVAGQHVQQAGGEPGQLEQPGEQDAAGDGGLHVRLEDDRVTEGERRGDRTGRQDQREVPRADHADHAERDALGDALPTGLAGRQQVPPGLGGQRRGLPQLTEDQLDLEGGLARYGTALADQPALELGAVVLEDAGGAADQRGPLRPGLGGPFGLGLLRGCCRRRHVAGVGEPHGREYLSRGRLGGLQHPAARGGPAGAVDLALPVEVVEEFSHDGSFRGQLRRPAA
jgi:hypothetical protein